MSVTARHRLALILFCTFMWLPGLPARTLWPLDEPRYALIARDMAESGDYIVPIKRGEVYHSQPPLYLWTEVLSARLLGGLTETAARLPSFLAAVGCVLVVYALGASLFGAGAGLMSALVLATDVRYLLSAQWAATDMLLCFFMTSTLAAFYKAWVRGDRRWYYVMCTMAGLGTMTKGPIGFVLPGMVILCCLVVRRDLREVLRMRLHWGVLIVSAILAPWLVLFWRQAGTHEVANLVLKQSFQRYTSAWNNIAPWHFFLWQFPLDFLPWAPLFAVAAAASAARMEKEHRAFLWSWFGVIFLFFSASTGKRGVYLLPLHPAAAILTGWLWHRALQGDRGESLRKWLRYGSLAIGVIFAGLGLVLLSPVPARAGFPPEARGAILVLALLCLTCGAAIVLLPSRRVFMAIAGGTALLSLGGVLMLAPFENRRQNIRPFAAEIARRVPEGASLGIVRDRFEDLIFYSHRDARMELRSGRRLVRWLSRPETVYAVLDRTAYDDLKTRVEFTWDLLDHQVLAGDEYYLIVRR